MNECVRQRGASEREDRARAGRELRGLRGRSAERANPGGFVRFFAEELSPVQRAAHSQAGAIEGVRVDHGGADVRVSEQFLHGAYVGSVLEQMGGERVAQDVRGDGLGDSGLAGGLAHASLDLGLMQVMAPGVTGSRVDGKSGRGEHVLPAPFAGASAVFESDARLFCSLRWVTCR